MNLAVLEAPAPATTLRPGLGLPIARYRFTFRMEDELRLPEFAGSLIRGQFGASLRSIACMTGAPVCPGCPLYRTCPYPAIFETPPPESHALQRFSQVPNPYVIEPPTFGRRLVAAGETVSFHIVLVGRALGQLPLIAYAFQRAFERGIGKLRARGRIEDIALVGAGFKPAATDGAVERPKWTLTSEPPHPDPFPHSASKTRVNALMGERESTERGASSRPSGERGCTESGASSGPFGESESIESGLGPLSFEARARALRDGALKKRASSGRGRALAPQDDGGPQSVWDAEHSRIEPHEPTLTVPRFSEAGSITLKFTTPLRLQSQGHPVSPEKLRPRTLFTALLRRASLLLELHAGMPPVGTQASRLAAAAERLTDERSLQWKDWTRFSSRQKRAMTLGGVIGEWKIFGELDELLPWFWLGQWLHVGKETTMGMGMYSMDLLEGSDV